MKRSWVVVASTVVGVGLLALAGFATSAVPKGARQPDSGLASTLRAALEADEQVRASQVEVEFREGVVYLTGLVDTEEERCAAGRVARRTAGIAGVENELTVGERTVDGWVEDEVIRSKVRSKLLAHAAIRAGDVDVSSSQGTVTLLGNVGSGSIRKDAERIARATRGVRDVNNHLVAGKIRR